MRHALTVVLGTLLVLMCIDNPSNIKFALLGIATGVCIRLLLNKGK